ncbi:LysR family transcriptional regulator [Pseudomonas turukhanskensis]|uniref:LysR family transcriptional regulator n=1 Tax=Pseudomonas turukhanskensis TaxID=1806536 RepID=A0A9W6K516_9PSED|nr:LysR family transcriptional regulator [Pseudomonas turukhanskensis]GLK87845.1 LysR family transcriptional regulator [Pseudomonas turukhanskensis]
MLNRMELLKILCAAAEANSFREAATRLSISPQSVTRAIQELEQQFGEILFHRSTRQVQITAFGQSLVAQAQQTLDSVDQLFQRNTRNKVEAISGRVGITAPHAIGRRFLVQLLVPLLREQPGLQVELRLEDEMTDAVSAQIDIGIRVGMIRDRRYIARPMAKVPLHIVASPALVASGGAPQTLEQLHERPLSALIDRRSGKPWPWLFANNEHLLPAPAAFISDDPEAELEVVLAGLAYAQVPSYLAVPHLRSGALVTVLDRFAPTAWDLFIYRPQRGPVSPRVRLVFDHLLAQFSDKTLFPEQP